MTEIQKHTW